MNVIGIVRYDSDAQGEGQLEGAAGVRQLRVSTDTAGALGCMIGHRQERRDRRGYAFRRGRRNHLDEG